MNKREFPKIHFYDQDFVDIYNKTWMWTQKLCLNPKTSEPDSDGYFFYPVQNGWGQQENPILDQFDSVLSSFFLVYSNRNYAANQNLDYFYSKQEENGAIRWQYDVVTGQPRFDASNPSGIGLPLFAWAEYNLYHKTANKKRIKEVVPVLRKYMDWVEAEFRQENGLFAAPFAATRMFNSPREGTVYPVDFNSALAINALFMSALGDILNDKEMNFQYKRLYFSLKTRINTLMWSPESAFYHDLNENLEILPVKTIAGFLPLLAEIPNNERADLLVGHLNNPATFGTEHPFPSLSADDPRFSPDGEGYLGSVFPQWVFFIIKGLEHYQKVDIAREFTIRHLYCMLETFAPNLNASPTFDETPPEPGDLWEAYRPCSTGIASMKDFPLFPRKRALLTIGLSTITLMIENIIGLEISLPRKTVFWVIPNLEIMGIENLSLKRNLITILSNKNVRGWEIQMESEKLYYFTINILGYKKKTLPIPSGKCSMFIDKL